MPDNARSAAVRPARRVHAKSVERRKRILDAAARALAEHGYSGAKLSDIAQQAGTHAGSLYYYFPSRENLVQEVLVTSLDRMSEFSAALDEDASLSPLDRVTGFVGLVIEQALAPDDHYFRAFLRNGDQAPESIREVLKARRTRMRRTLARLLQSAQAAGEIASEVDPNVAAQFILGAANWAGVWYEPGGAYSIEQLTASFLSLMLNGLGPRAA